jgi:hypothetical protein
VKIDIFAAFVGDEAEAAVGGNAFDRAVEHGI